MTEKITEMKEELKIKTAILLKEKNNYEHQLRWERFALAKQIAQKITRLTSEVNFLEQQLRGAA